MANKNIISERDRKVKARWSILNSLEIGCEELNSGNRKPLADAILRLNNKYSKFSATTKTHGVYEFFGDDYTEKDGIVIVKEHDGDKIKELIIILKLKSGLCKGEWRTYELSPYLFETDAQREAEAQWEQDAESAYERYYDYKSSLDDPRGF